MDGILPTFSDKKWDGRLLERGCLLELIWLINNTLYKLIKTKITGIVVQLCNKYLGYLIFLM